MRIAIAQFDSRLGEVDANLDRIDELTKEANALGADLTVFPELATHGYALGDIGENRSVPSHHPRFASLASGGSDVLVGFHEDDQLRTYNAAAYWSDDRLVHLHRKLYLPNYLVWEERKHSSPGQHMQAFDTRHGRFATLICNDAWQPMLPWLAAQDGAELLIVPTNSATGLGPDSLDTIEYWEMLLTFIARMQQCWVVFVNRVGTESGARFWGGSRVIDPNGEIVAAAPLWDEALVTVDIDLSAAHTRRREVPLLADARLSFLESAITRLMEQGGDR